MGCGNSALDPEIKTLSQKINSSIQAKSTLQYQISQLKFLQEAKKAYPDIKEVKEAQIQNLKLSKEIKDTENLLQSIKENEMQSEDIKVLEATYAKLENMLEERDEEIKVLEEEVSVEAKTLEEYQNNFKKLNEESEKLRGELDILMTSEKYKTIKSLEDTIEQLEIILEQKTNEYMMKSPSPDELGSERSASRSASRGASRKSQVSKIHQQLIFEIKRKSELEDTLKEIRSKTEGTKESYLGEELRSEIYKLEAEEKELTGLINDAESKKKLLEKGKNEGEMSRNTSDNRKDFDILESRFENAISNLMSGVGEIRSEKDQINEENRKLKIELAGSKQHK